MRAAYADPPYIGMAKRFYSADPQCAEVDHRELISRLCDEYDAWALSLHSPALKTVLPMCPDDVRVMAWVKPFASYKPGVGVAYAWEPILVRLSRKRSRQQRTVRDWVAVNITLQRGLVGAKPTALCYWLFSVLNLDPGDEFHDMYPGSGAVTKAWEAWKQLHSTTQQELELICA